MGVVWWLRSPLVPRAFWEEASRASLVASPVAPLVASLVVSSVAPLVAPLRPPVPRPLPGVWGRPSAVGVVAVTGWAVGTVAVLGPSKVQVAVVEGAAGGPVVLGERAVLGGPVAPVRPSASLPCRRAS